MRQLFIFYTLCSFLLLSVASCTDKEESIRQVEPGIYYIEKNLSAVATSTQTRGIVDKSYDFDANYDYAYIYLHTIAANDNESDGCIEIPVYNDCPNNINDSKCVGFRYRIEVNDDGSATIYALNKDGNDTGKFITLEQNQNCYFSSWPTDEWALRSDQISQGKYTGQDDVYYLYYRDKTVNKEIYRSGNGYKYNNLSIQDLTTHGDLELTRACATFALVALFFDKTAGYTVDDITTYNTTKDAFNEALGDPSNWYIKIYIGGNGFCTTYNIENNTTQENLNGYYSSGDADKFEIGEIVGKRYLSFGNALKGYTSNSEVFYGFGYRSQYENTLLTPVTGLGNVKAYVLIKHWTGGPEGPSEAWLNSDIGALQTTVTQYISDPQNADAYVIGFAMDINLFNKAWNGVDAEGHIIEGAGDKAQNDLIEAAGIDTGTSTSGGSDNSTSGAYSTTITRSPSGDPVRTFTLPEGAIVIREVY